MKYSYLFAFIMTMVVSACTRPVADKASSMTIALPKQMKLKAANSAQALGFLGHVVINVRGAGIDVPITVNFDADKGDSSQPTSLPRTFSIEVPAGAGRLIQIMAIYIDVNTKIGDFYYGDVTQDLVSGDNNIAMPVNLVGSGNIEGGRVGGRYYLADGSTPTGVTETRYQPPGGKPAFVIDRSSILKGWFTTFALDSVPMDVVLVPGEVQMFSNMKLDDFNSTTLTDNKKMKVLLPSRYQDYGNNNGDSRGPETAVFGFFGAGVPSGAKVCYIEGARTYTKIFTDSTKATAVQWAVSSSKAADVRAIKSGTVATCSTSDISSAYTTVIPFRPVLLENWGGSNSAIGFEGAFRFPDDVTVGSSPVRVSYDNSGQYNAQFSVLPGIPDVANSVGVFYRSYNSPRDYQGNGSEAPCQQFAQGGLGFKSIASIPLTIATTTYNVNNASPADISSSAVMAFCPMKDGVPVGGGFVVDHFDNSMGQSPLAANSFTAQSDFNTVGTGQCHKIRLQLINESNGNTNYNVTNSVSRTFSLFGTATNIRFHADESTCVLGTSYVTSVNMPANNNFKELWFKDPTEESETVTISTSSFATALSRTVNVSFQAVSSASYINVKEQDIKMGADECRVVDVYTVDSSWIPAPGATTISLAKKDSASNAITDTSFNFYSDCSSATAITSLAFTATDFRKSFAIKTGASPSSDRKIELSGLGTPYAITFRVTPIADHMSILINNGNPVYKGSCVPLYIEAQDFANAKVNNATFDFSMNAYHPTAPNSYGDFKMNCASPHSTGTLATGSYSSITFSAYVVQNGLKMEAQSIYQSYTTPINFDIKPAPPVERTTLKVHLMSDDLTPTSTVTSLVSWPRLDTTVRYTDGLNNWNSVSVNSNPRVNGALFDNTSYFFGSLSNAGVTDPIVATIKFKLDALPTGGSIIDILKIDNGTSWGHAIYIDDTTNGVFKIKGTGSWVGPTIEAGTWYTVSLSSDGSSNIGSIHGYVNGADYGAGTSGNGNPGTGSYLNFKVGSGFSGAVKAVIIDVGAGAPMDLTGVIGDHQYINGRVSDN